MKFTIVASLFIAAVSAASVPAEVFGRAACSANEIACRYGDDCCSGYCAPRGQQLFCGNANGCIADNQKCISSNSCCSGYCGWPGGNEQNGLRCTYK